MPTHHSLLDRYFPSKRDWWIVGLIWMGLLISMVGGIIPIMNSETAWLETTLVVCIVVGMDGLMLWVLYGTGYRVTPNMLFIQCGPFSFRISLTDIESIVPTHSLWSSPACSADRLKIVYGLSKNSIMISPNDKPGLLAAIVHHCPTLVVLHDQVQKAVSSDRNPQPQVST